MKQLLFQKYINPYITKYYDKTCVNMIDWYDHNNNICTTLDKMKIDTMIHSNRFKIYSNNNMIKFLYNSKFKLSKFYIAFVTKTNDIDMFYWCYENIIKMNENIKNDDKYLLLTLKFAINNQNFDILYLIEKYLFSYLLNIDINYSIIEHAVYHIHETCNLNMFKWLIMFIDMFGNIDEIGWVIDNENKDIIDWFKSSKYYDNNVHCTNDEYNQYINLICKSIKDSPNYDKICKLAIKYHDMNYDCSEDFYEKLLPTLKISC